MITEKSKEDTGVKQKSRKSRLQNGEYEYGKVQIYERNGLWYELQGDYYSPCLKLSEKEQTNCKT